MNKELREFIDRRRDVRDTYYELEEGFNGRNVKAVKKQLKALIEEYPDFLDSYLFLREILQDEGKIKEADKLLDNAYNRAIKLITDEKGNWPDILGWGCMRNRHVIRTILNKAISLWDCGKDSEALVIFRKLLKTNPGDNIGAREFILAIRMKMSFKKFEKRFDKGGYTDADITHWFAKNYRKFPDEFDWWKKAVEKFM